MIYKKCPVCAVYMRMPDYTRRATVYHGGCAHAILKKAREKTAKITEAHNRCVDKMRKR